MQTKKLANPIMITLAREAAGLTQGELAEILGLNQGNISRIENGLISPSPEIVANIANSLSFPISVFFKEGAVYSPQIHFFRKAKSLANKDFSQIKANGTLDRLRIEDLLSPLEIDRDYKTYDLSEYGAPDAIANALRHDWSIPRGPIPNLTELLESKGFIIISVDFGTRLIS